MTWTNSLRFLEDAPPELLLTWDIGRGSILNQNIGMSYLAQCCGIQAEFEIQLSAVAIGLPGFFGPPVQRVVRAHGPESGNFSNFLGAFGGLVGQ